MDVDVIVDMDVDLGSLLQGRRLLENSAASDGIASDSASASQKHASGRANA